MAKDIQKARTTGADPATGNGHVPVEASGIGFEDATALASTPAVSGAEFEAMRPRRNRWRIVLPILLVVAAAVAVAWWLLRPQSTVPTAIAQRGTIISTV